jgi:isopentenyl diphosphate isomerase/L-lactate dehydrogenase-like FMN-dependent dehydrogenase
VPAVAARLKGKIPILADGSVTTGTDVVPGVGSGLRHGGPAFVARRIRRRPGRGRAFHEQDAAELQSAMVLMGVSSAAKIDGSILYTS